MSWTDKVGSLLKQYSTSGGAAAQPAPDVHAHFDEVAQAVPPEYLGRRHRRGIPLRQDSCNGSDGFQPLRPIQRRTKGRLAKRADLLINPATLTQILSGAGLGGILSGLGSSLTPAQAQQIPPEVVQDMANHAEKANPSIVDSLSNFYAQHSALIKTLGGGALTIALAKIAQRQNPAHG